MIRHAPGEHDARLRSFYGDLGGRFANDAWYAEVGGEVVGTATIGPPHAIHGPWVGELHRLEVRLDHRRQGVGTRLHDACVDAWRARGITVGVVELRADDPATRDFFESRGWQPDGHTRQGFHGITYLRLRRTIN
jgi:GNAT superfamily N-acetyltransferase